jgi:hypothetical protein
MEAVKKANEGSDSGAIQKALDDLTAAQHKAAEALYKQQGAPGAGGGPGGAAGSQPGGAPDGSASGGGKTGDVIDAEVVDDKT